MVFKKTLQALVLGTALALSGCENDSSIVDGQVYEKMYHPAYTDTIFMPMKIGDSTILIPMNDYHHESYEIRFQKNVNGRRIIGSRKVEKTEFEKVKIGDNYGLEKIE